MRTLFHALVSTLVFTHSCLALAQQPEHVVVIMADDLDHGLFDALMDRGLLPHIKEHLVDRGVRFANYYVTNPICCPSRGTFLTGQYSHNHGALTVLGPDLFTFGLRYWLENPDGSPEKNTLPIWLSRRGYHTAHIGKYLNGYGYDTEESYLPPGWKDWRGLIDISTYSVYDYRMNLNGTIKEYGNSKKDYQTDVLTNHATEVIRSFARQGQGSLFSVIAPLAPHVEHGSVDDAISIIMRPFYSTIRPAPRHRRYLDGNESNGEVPDLEVKESHFLFKRPGKPKWLQKKYMMEEMDITDVKNQFRSQGASMLAVDDMVGKVVEELQRAKLWQNTWLIFTSDNGWFHGQHGLTQKALAYEESSRVPFLITGPGVRSPYVERRLAANVDLAATIVDIAGADPEIELDGRSLLPLLTQPEKKWPRKRILIENFKVRAWSLTINPPTYQALREVNGGQNFLYTEWLEGYVSDGDLTTLDREVVFQEFYDLNSDPLQIKNLKPPNQWRTQAHMLLEHFAKCRGSSCRNLEESALPFIQPGSLKANKVVHKKHLKRHIPKFSAHLHQQTLWIQIWVYWLIIVNSISFVFIKRPLARWVAIAWCFNVPLMMTMFSIFGFTRILGSPHLLCWLPLLTYLIPRMRRQDHPGFYGKWLKTVVVSIIISLVFDAVDVVRYFVET